MANVHASHISSQLNTHCPVVVSGEEESTEETVRDDDGVAATPSFLYVTPERLEKRRHPVVNVCTTKQEREEGKEGERTTIQEQNLAI